MKFFKGMAPAYANEMFKSADQCQVTRRSKFKLNLPFHKSSAGQKCLSYMGPKIWNSLSSDLKSTNSINLFKHKIKDNFFPKYTERGKTHYTVCSTRTAHPLSYSCFSLTIFMIYTKAHSNLKFIICFNHLYCKRTIMEIRSS